MLFKPPGLWHLVTAARDDSDKDAAKNTAPWKVTGRTMAGTQSLLASVPPVPLRGMCPKSAALGSNEVMWK